MYNRPRATFVTNQQTLLAKEASLSAACTAGAKFCLEKQITFSFHKSFKSNVWAGVSYHDVRKGVDSYNESKNRRIKVKPSA